jgi:regulator of replication initiation timing
MADPDTDTLRLALHDNSRRTDVLNVKDQTLGDALARSEHYVDRLKERLRETREELAQLAAENEWLRVKNSALASNRNRLREQQL